MTNLEILDFSCDNASKICTDSQGHNMTFEMYNLMVQGYESQINSVNQLDYSEAFQFFSFGFTLYLSIFITSKFMGSIYKFIKGIR